MTKTPKRIPDAHCATRPHRDSVGFARMPIQRPAQWGDCGGYCDQQERHEPDQGIRGCRFYREQQASERTPGGHCDRAEINTPGDGRKATNVERRVGGTGGTGTHSSGLIAAISGGVLWELLNFANEASWSPIRVMERHEIPASIDAGSLPNPQTREPTGPSDGAGAQWR